MKHAIASIAHPSQNSPVQTGLDMSQTTVNHSPSWSRKLLLVGVSVLVSGLLAEGLVRLVWENPFAAEQPELLVHVATQAPNTNRQYMGPGGRGDLVKFRTDSRGYILPSRTGVAGAQTVAFFGGSTTECSALAEQTRFPALTAALLAKRGLAIDALNTGRSGNTTHEALNILLNHTLADEPDIAVLMHAVNDTGILANNGDYSHAMAHREGMKWGGRAIARKLAGSISLIGLVRFIKLGGARHDGKRRVYEEKRQKAPDLPYRQRLIAFVQLCRAFAIEPVLMTQAMAYVRDKETPTWAEPAKQAVFNDIVRAVGKQHDATVIDLDAGFRSIDGWDKPDRFFYDGLHLNDKGAQVAAKLIADGLEPVLRRRKQQRPRLPDAATATTK